MKLSAVYKSLRKVDTYLYVEKRDDFSSVPDALMQQFGEPQFVMLVPLVKHDIIAGIKTTTLVEKLQAEGFYLQLPPKVQDLLKRHVDVQEQSGTTNAH